MAANRIKGITVEIGGDTTKLQTALQVGDIDVEMVETTFNLHGILFFRFVPSFGPVPGQGFILLVTPL